MAHGKRCPGSGQWQSLAFGPTEYDNYPGGTACAVCSMGVLAVKGSPELVMDDRLGYEVWIGKLEVHDQPKERR